MIPTNKSQQIENLINQLSGDNRRSAITQNRCLSSPIGCGKPVSINDFKDDLSIKEFKISGLCQTCQNKVFGGD